jgi:hypothetical protein
MRSQTASKISTTILAHHSHGHGYCMYWQEYIINSIILWHVDLLLGNDRERSSYTTATAL